MSFALDIYNFEQKVFRDAKMQLELLLTAVSTVSTVIGSAAILAHWLGKKFTEIDLKFRRVDERFEQVNRRFEQIDERFKQVDRRFDEMKVYIDRKFEELWRRVNNRIRRLGEAFTSYQEFFVEYLSSEGLLRSQKALLLKREAIRVMRLALMNPLTKEEWAKIKYYLDKDELTLEEALEFRELARKVVREYGEYPEAWKLHIYASIKVGEALRKMRETEENVS